MSYTPAHRRPARARADSAETSAAIRRIGALALLAFATALLLGAFAGIVVFVVGLAALAAYAASHPHHT